MDQEKSGETSSAVVSVRMPSALRDRLARAAAKGERTTNAEIVRRLGASFESPPAPVLGQLLDALDVPRVSRLRSTSTTADCRRLALVAEHCEVDRLVLATKPESNNGAVLVAVLYGREMTFVMDRTLVNIARPPRIGEVERLFRQLDTLGLLERAELGLRPVSETRELAPQQAEEQLAREVALSSAWGDGFGSRLRAFLNLLAHTWSVEDLSPFRA